ncbi:Vibriobactin utilization protein ViuB [Jannaschia seosinensis]|uniref:Vibriobactin utilization protein ViuB n=1 Tax=Jannaschia seosinensis TaxID=313367 RepID=A0A0M7B980_9RHOB|nr:siderophore-interacting protein [Jannaschia seosinensis]CUH39280.1 Vibriobactin utilization protein ViuB [Jannaschia seosinensis]
MARSDTRVNGQLTTRASSRLLDGIVTFCRDFEIEVTDARPRKIDICTDIGSIGFACGRQGLTIQIRAESAANAYMLQESVAAQVEAAERGCAAALRWNRAPAAGEMPPNFRVGRVLSVTETDGLFWRLTLEAPDLAPFARDGLHLRLALPPRDRAPVWPVVGQDGRPVWPDGPDALHVAVYTIRQVDPDSGRMVVDAYRHGKGATCAWLAEARPGDALGLMGPGGGWMPSAGHLVLAGDETALPAITRILEAAPAGTCGTVIVETARTPPPLSLPDGVTLRFVARDRGECLEAEFARTGLGPAGDRHVWFAAEKARAAHIRTLLRRDYGVDRRESYVAGYWAADS